MKIPVSTDKHAIVDATDFKRLSAFKWHLNSNGYARRNLTTVDGRRGMVYMHSEIMRAPKGKDTDHINHNKLDNRRANLRICTRSENGMNRGPQANNTSGAKGVSWYARDRTWEAYIKVRGKKHTIGRFKSKVAAVRARNEAAARFHGEFAYIKRVRVNRR